MKTVLIFLVALLSGCGRVDVATNPYTPETGHQGAPTPRPLVQSPQPPPPMSPAGIWDINGNGMSEVAVIAGGMYFSLATIDEFGCAHISGGNYTVHPGEFTGSGVTALLDNCAQPNYFGWTLAGSLIGGDLTLGFTDGSIAVPRVSATLDPLYTLYKSSLITLVGNWNDGGNVLTVNPDGTFFEQQGSGCTITGAYSIIDPAYNLYGVTFLFDPTTCTNSLAGIQFKGLAYLTPNTSSGWYHLLEDAFGTDATGAVVVVFDSLTPYFTPPTG